ncbi:MAG: ATP-binding protein [Candidatus Sericytochromatia bacterium]
MTTQGPVPAEVYQLCFEHSPWPSLLVDRTLLRVQAANHAAQELLPPDQPTPELAAVLELESPLTAEDAPGSNRLALARPCLQDEFLPCLLLPLNAELLLIQLVREPAGELERLRRISQRKSELIANISHELRTPLTAILGWPEIILDSADMPALAVQAASSIRKDGVFLRQLLDDLIDLSRIEAGYLTLDIQSEDLCQIVLDAVDMLAEKARQKGLQLETDLPEQPVWAAVDSVRMMQVVLNYLSNAIKYTQSGGQILLQVRSGREEAVLMLQDTGIGMKEEVRQHIFERFMRADEVHSSDGAGIGLSLVKKLVELHGGHCWVESQHGQGSTFYVSIPLARSRTGRRIREQAHNSHSLRRLAQTRLLIVDERPEELSLLSQLLQPYFRQVRPAEALPDPETLKADLPDLVLISTSLQAPAHQVWIQALRQDPKLAALRVVALSASAMRGDAARLQALGYSGSLSKPFLKEDLLQYIQHLLRTAHV